MTSVISLHFFASSSHTHTLWSSSVGYAIIASHTHRFANYLIISQFEKNKDMMTFISKITIYVTYYEHNIMNDGNDCLNLSYDL